MNTEVRFHNDMKQLRKIVYFTDSDTPTSHEKVFCDLSRCILIIAVMGGAGYAYRRGNVGLQGDRNRQADETEFFLSGKNNGFVAKRRSKREKDKLYVEFVAYDCIVLYVISPNRHISL